ncbi:MAG: DUF3999 family protein [Proteobacteria bacterium]|nr:DUF3999 family protein [Pseudomonadota bacterium]
MKSLVLIIATCIAADTALAQSGHDETVFPEMNDYAWGFPVVVREPASFYSIRLPLDVNQSVTDPELRDAGVYNADGDPLPRIFQPASDDIEQVERTRPLPFVPLFKNSKPITSEDIQLLFERRGDFARIELSTDAPPDEAGKRELRSYIVDTRELDEGIEALDLYWTQVDTGFIGQVSVEGSNSLGEWAMLGSAAVADLNEASTSIVQRRVRLSRSTHDYLRITWNDVPAGWGLADISAVYTLGVKGIVREEFLLTQSEIDADDGGRVFSLGGAPKIDRVRVVLPVSNTVITSDVYLWSESQGRWYRVIQENWHHIGQGDSIIESDAVDISRTRSSRVKVVVTHGQPDAEIHLEIGWRPDTLLFLAQGPAPYTLATGRAVDAESGFPQHRTYGVRSITSLASGNGQASVATLGSRIALGGTDRLHTDDKVDWRTLTLWFGLALGVAFVGFMAMRIMRESKGQETTSE